MKNIFKTIALSLAVSSVPAMATSINVSIGAPIRPVVTPVVPVVPVGPAYGYGRLVCKAQNRRGQIFTAVGHNPRNVQARAIAQCNSVSRFSCRPLGCR